MSNPNPLVRAKVIATQRIVYVYKLIEGGWCDSADYETSYSDNQLEFIK